MTQSLQQRLIQGLSQIPSDFPLVPLNGNKRPLGEEWQHRPFTPVQLLKGLERRWLKVLNKRGELYKVWLPKNDRQPDTYQIGGYGLMTGLPILKDGLPYYLMALDQDGASAAAKIQELSGGEPLPKTVAFSSGRPGRCQYLFLIPEEYAEAVRTKKIKTKDKTDTEDVEHLEFRWKGLQSVLPPSIHPITGSYHYLEGCALGECPIAIAPMWVLEQMLVDSAEGHSSDTQPLLEEASSDSQESLEALATSENLTLRGIEQYLGALIPSKCSWSDIDWAAYYLKNLASWRADGYDDWIHVGMAAHDGGNDLLQDWDGWSRQSPKYKPGECQKKWKSFSSGSGYTIASIFAWAKEDGVAHPKYSDFENFVTKAYQFWYEGKLERFTLNSLLWQARQNFWSWKLHDCAWEQLIQDVVSKLPEDAAINSEKDIVWGTSADLAKKGRGRLLDAASGSGSGNGGDGGENSKLPLTEITMRQRVTEILSRDLEPSAETEAFKELALSTGWHLKDIREMATFLEEEWDKEDSRSERKEEIEQLEKYKERALTLGRYLPACYADPMTLIAKWMGAPTAAFLTVLLPAFASCNHPDTRIVVKRSIGFIEPLIIYSGIVTESGQRKSPVMNAVLDALKELQAEEEDRFKHETDEYERELEQWQESKPTEARELNSWLDNKPTPPRPVQEFYLDKATVEAIDAIKGRQPDCSFMLIKDELSGLFASYGAYKNGRGEDKQSFLSSWNGRGTKKNLKGGERVSTLRDAMSLVGGIQDSYLQKLMGNFDDDLGEWSRFLWTLMPLKALRLPADDTEFQLGFLKDLYARARHLLPQEYKFAFDAQALYDNYHWKLEQRRVSNPRRGMRAAISKMEGYTARLALALHLIWELAAGKTHPSQFIPKERVKSAIALSEFYLSQVELIHAEGAAALGEGGLSHRLSAILSKLKLFGELKARTIQAAISWLRKEAPGKLRQNLIELASLGYGKLVGKGNRLKLVYTATSVDSAESTVESSADSQEEAQPIDIRTIQEFPVDSADTVDTPPQVFPTGIENDSHGGNEILEPSDFEPNAQLLSSLASNLEESNVMDVDGLSAEVSTVEEDPSPDDDPDPPNPGPGGGVPAPELELQPTLADLQALLRACETLSQYEAIQRKYGELALDAYRAMSAENQLKVDGLIASQYSFPIFKYVGEWRIRNGQTLEHGGLVRLRNDKKHLLVGVLPLDCRPGEEEQRVIDVASKHLVEVPRYQAPPQGEQLSFA